MSGVFLMNAMMMSGQVDASASKKAILVVSFGTSVAETRKVTIEACEQKIQAAFPDYEVRRAFTSEKIISILFLWIKIFLC